MRSRLANLNVLRRRSLGRCRLRPCRRGFTFVEVAITTAIIGLGMAGLVNMMAASSGANYTATQLTTAMNLANNIHELTERLAYADGHFGMESGETIANCNSCDDLSGLRLGTAGTSVVDAVGQNMPTAPGMDWTGWQQQVDIALVNPSNVRQTLTSTDTSVNDVMRITCTIVHNGNQVYQQSWNIVHTK
jgi:prepilin-type N-terminal cleavage/methylation domain-containing protein